MPAENLEKSLSDMNFTELQEKVESKPQGDGLEELKDRRKELKPLLTELESRKEYPEGKKIVETFEGLVTDEKIDLAEKLIKRAMAENNVDYLDPNKAVKLNGELPLNELDENNSESQVYYKQVTTKERNWLGKTKELPTDEVQIIIRLNNGKNKDGEKAPENNSIIIGVVKQSKDGVPQLDNSEGSFLILSQGEYDRRIVNDKEGTNDKWLRGELTNQLYVDKFKKDHGESIFDYQDRRDEELPETDEYWDAEREKGDLFKRVEGEYGHLLQEAQKEIEDIKQKVKEARKVVEAHNREIIHSDAFQSYIEEYTRPDANEEQVKRLKRMLSGTFSLDDKEIEGLMNRKRKLYVN